MVEAILRAGESMAGYGITCATDMMTGRFDLEKELQAYKIAANRGCAIRTRLCVQWSPLFGPRALDRGRFNELLADFNSVETKVIGAKIFCDGAIASATAAIYGKFEPVEAKGPIISKHAKAISTSADGREVSGQLIYSPERMNQMVQIAHDQGFAVAIHGIGDYAVDLVLNAFEATGEPSRHRVEHAMLMSDAQIMRLASLNVHCTFQPEFLYRFGHAYRRQLGDERASKLKRIRSTLDAGVSVSINSDRPIVVGDPWVGVSTAAIRPPAFDPAENITLREAILGYTKGGAVANGDEGEMGEIKVGQHADFMIVDGPCEPHKPIEFELHRGRPN
jgi:predicted amidohydrolase YtcJ